MRINIGSSGRQFPGWVHLDRERVPGAQLCDVRLGIPFGNATVDVAVASHVIEHLHPFNELPFVLQEVFRVLKPGGVFRVAVPDLVKLVSAYEDHSSPPSQATMALAESQRELKDYVGVMYSEMPAALRFSVICFGNNSKMPYYDGHQWIADLEALQWVLRRAGFTDVRPVEPQESRFPGLMTTYQDVEAAEEIVVEATRP